MTLTTTPGAADADSYASLADADSYFSARGVSTWTGADDLKEQALRRATSYLDNQYRDRWIGRRATETQALAWPRIDGTRGYGYPLLDSDGYDIGSTVVPTQIKRATFEAALLVLSGTDLEPRLERGGAIKSIGKGVGPLRKDITYMDGAPAVDRITVLEGLLRGLVTGSPGATAGNFRLVRS